MNKNRHYSIRGGRFRVWAEDGSIEPAIEENINMEVRAINPQNAESMAKARIAKKYTNKFGENIMVIQTTKIHVSLIR